jgi:hypothetical protein
MQNWFYYKCPAEQKPSWVARNPPLLQLFANYRLFWLRTSNSMRFSAGCVNFFSLTCKKTINGMWVSAASNLNLMLYYRSLCITSDYQSRALLVMSLMSSRVRYWSSEHCCGSGTVSHQCFQLSFEVVTLKYVCWFVALLTRLSYLVQKQNWEYLKCSITRSTRLSICYWTTCTHERWNFGMIFCSVVIF